MGDTGNTEYNDSSRVESRRDETRRDDDIELGVGYLCIVFNVATQGVSMFVPRLHLRLDRYFYLLPYKLYSRTVDPDCM